ncbi:MAG: site-2 protease family protein [Verrucomicrobiae bacterium]|nr:site-2 protease family protein [Verrucomicrobiae bacterium]NNJ86952.1 hypothetical protein [Akkermansiaceae bacterium]
MIQFTLFGIPVRIEPWFWLTCAFLGGILYAQTADDFLRVAMFTLAAFVSVLIHEMGHALTIRKYRLPTQVVLSTFGGYATYPSGILTRKQSFLVTAAGPLIQLVFGLLVLLAQAYLPAMGGRIDLFAYYLILISIVWAVFNCLPIYPMDGGQMLAAILGPRKGKALHLTGLIVSVGVGLLALSYGWYFMAIFMGMFAYQNFQMSQQYR